MRTGCQAQNRSLGTSADSPRTRRFDRDWKKIEAYVQTKTVVQARTLRRRLRCLPEHRENLSRHLTDPRAAEPAQIRSHAQKYFLKVQKNGTGEHVPPPRPKRKSLHPYPTKEQGGNPGMRRCGRGVASRAWETPPAARADLYVGMSAPRQPLSARQRSTRHRGQTSITTSFGAGRGSWLAGAVQTLETKRAGASRGTRTGSRAMRRCELPLCTRLNTSSVDFARCSPPRSVPCRAGNHVWARPTGLLRRLLVSGGRLRHERPGGQSAAGGAAPLHAPRRQDNDGHPVPQPR